jgi:hypothetical protein
VGSPDERRYPGGPAGVVDSPEEALAVAVELCAEERFFEAHEFLEHAWNVEREIRDREFWKGLTQIAVGCCHLQRGNSRGALRLLERGARRLAEYPERHRGIDVGAVIAVATAFAGRLRDGDTPALPVPLLVLVSA